MHSPPRTWGVVQSGSFPHHGAPASMGPMVKLSQVLQGGFRALVACIAVRRRRQTQRRGDAADRARPCRAAPTGARPSFCLAPSPQAHDMRMRVRPIEQLVPAVAALFRASRRPLRALLPPPGLPKAPGPPWGPPWGPPLVPPRAPPKRESIFKCGCPRKKRRWLS
jgi:hypothetical protein